ncbi:MAG: CCA tRNA nucleotidyltransferase, partial [Bacillota bacterium]
MEKRKKLLNKLLNSKAEEYFSFNNKIIKVNNLIESDFKKLGQKTKNQIEADYLIIENEVYFNKQSSSLAQSKLNFLHKVKAGEHHLTAHNNLLYKNLSLDLNKALDLLKKYKKNKHQQASFLHYDSDLLDYLPQQRRKLLLKLAKEASLLGYNLYLVGGQVRDLLINIPLNKDLDILLEGDLKKFFVHLENKYGYQYDYNNKFSTGFLHNQYGFSIDIASCREEKYHFPGSLPLVEKADLFSDLFRRDFTINTLVIDLNPARSGILYDFFGALNDLKNGILKVMHDYSFRDDPLRILRGIRFQILKDFKLSSKTIEISQRSLKNYDYHKLAIERVFTELSYLFKSKQDLSQFASVLLKEIPVLKLIKSDFEFSSNQESNFLRAEKLLAQSRENSLGVNHFLVR